jgi:oligopeptide/dipeptide ABC transporter ATP-binding protein
VEGLSVVYETSRGAVRAVNDVSFSVNRGEVLALVGESGCGKSTVALALMRLVPPPGKIAGGKVWLEGQELLSLNDAAMVSVRGKQIAMIFQNPLVSLNPVYRAGSQVKEAIALDQMAHLAAWRKAVDIMGQVRISDAAERAVSYPHELSGGMRQRVMTGMMISRSPDLLIADEPTTALDVTIQAQILELLLDLRRRVQMSLLIITHNLGVVAEVADRVAVMYAGRIVEQADVFTLYESPRHPYSQLLLRALPRLAKGEGRLETIPGNVPNLVETITGCAFYPRCPRRIPVCLTTVPTMRPAGPTHQVACHLVEADPS